MGVLQCIVLMLWTMVVMDLAYDLPFIYGNFTVQDQLSSFVYYTKLYTSHISRFIDILIGIGFISMIFTVFKRKNFLSVFSLVILLGTSAYFASVVQPHQFGLLTQKFIENSKEQIESFVKIANGHIVLFSALTILAMIEIYQLFKHEK